MGNNNPNEIYVYVDSSPSQGISFLNLIINHGFQCMKASRFYTHELSASLLKSQTGEDYDFDIGKGFSQFEEDNGEFVLAFDLPSW